MATISDIGVSPTSTAWVKTMVNLVLTPERQPLTNLRSQQDKLQVRKGIYTDIKTKITTLQSSIRALQGLSNVFNQKSVVVTNPSTGDVAKAATSNTSAVAGSYSLGITRLAQSHQIGSKQVSQTDVALGLSGAFIIGGKASRELGVETTIANTVDDFGIAEPSSVDKELGSGIYHVEVRNNSNTYQFRLVDENGDVMRVADKSDPTKTTANWQNITSGVFDTKRGLTINFGDGNSGYAIGSKGAGAANVAYSAQGVNINVSSTDTLNDLRANINKATFADGNGVQATIVDRKLVLTGSRTGANATIQMSDNSGNVLQSLDFLADASGTLKAGAQLRSAQNADITLNNIHITNRTRNTGLTDLVQGLSIDLVKEGDTTITVNDDYGKVETEVKKFVDSVNDLRSYIKAKTLAKAGDKDDKGNPTYTSAPLGQDQSISFLRQEIANNLLKQDTQALGGDPKYLSEIGITVANDGSFALDTTKLKSALQNNFTGVKNLFAHLLEGDGTENDNSLNARLNRHVSGTSAVLTTKQNGTTEQLKMLESQIKSYQKRLSGREAALTQQYSAIQAQIIDQSYQFSSLSSLYK